MIVCQIKTFYSWNMEDRGILAARVSMWMAQNLQVFSPTREQENGYNVDVLSWIVLKGR